MKRKTRWRRWLEAPISLVLCASVACANHPVRVSSPKVRSREARKAYRSNAPAALSEYIRTVLKISQQNTLSNEEKLQKAVETSTNPAIDKQRSTPADRARITETNKIQKLPSAERMPVDSAEDRMESGNRESSSAKNIASSELQTNQKVKGDRTVRLRPSPDLTRDLGVLHEDLVAGWTTGIDKRLRIHARVPLVWQAVALLRATVAVAFTLVFD